MKRLDLPVVTSAGLDTLLLRVASGDEAAFAELYTLTSTRVLSLCRRLLIDLAAAEDATQDVYLEVWTKAAEFDPTRGAAIGWLLQIAHHRAVDRVPASECRRRRDTVYGSLADPPPPQPADSVFWPATPNRSGPRCVN